MKLKSLTLLVALTASFSSFANEHCALPENASECETITLIDFNENTAVEEASKELTGWQETLQNSYSKTEGDVSYIVVGSNPSYNFQGIKGESGNFFSDGEYLTVTFVNTTSDTVTFAPRISLDDVDAVKLGEQGVWSDMTDQFTLVPHGQIQAHFYFNSMNEGRFNLVNVNINEAANRSVGVDKITYTRHLPDAAELVYFCKWNTIDCKSYELIEFGGSLDSMRDKGQLIGFNEPLFGEYVHLGDYATGAAAWDGIKDQYFNAGVQSLNGTHEFKAGEVIEFDVSNTSNVDYQLNPKFSFIDSNNYKYGGEPEEAWHYMASRVIKAGDRITLSVEITPDMAGSHSLINFMPIVENFESTSDKLHIMSIRYLTAQDLHDKYKKL